MPHRKSLPRSRKPPEMVQGVDELDETRLKRIAGGSPVCLETAESPFCRLAIVGEPDGKSLTIHPRKSFF